MAGSANFSPYPIGLGGWPSFFAVARYDRDGGTITPLPNVLPLEITRAEGPVPPTASFAYVLDTTDPSSPFPVLVEEVWPLLTSGPYVIQNDDELLIYEFNADGGRTLVFDGFAQIPQVSLQGEGTAATFTAIGVAIRLWDQPIEGCDQRNGDDPEDGATVSTGLPTWFNPDGRPNCTPNDHAENQGGDEERPVFLDPLLPGDVQASWTLAGFVQYLLWTYNREQEYVTNPSSQDLIGYLVDVAPKEDQQFYDVGDSSTYDQKKIVLSSYNCTNKLPIEALTEQLHYYGFELFFDLREGEEGEPINDLIIYRKDGFDEAAPVELYYPAFGASLLDGLPDFSGVEMSLDQSRMVNEVAIETAPLEHEACFILAPAFEIDPGHADAISDYDLAKLVKATPEKRIAYRKFVFSEAGTGYWDFEAGEIISGPDEATSLDSVLGAPIVSDGGDPEADGVPQYVVRCRPGLATLVATDDAKKPYKASLEISRDYDGDYPGIWDGETGTWRSLGASGWRLLTDQLGIEITADNPETWRLPRNEAAGQTQGDQVRVISSLARPEAAGDTNTKKFTLKLTCKILDDSGIDVVAKKRQASPSRFVIRRRVDSKDHFKKQILHPGPNNTDMPPEDKVERDDTDAAKAKAQALRSATEFPASSIEFRVPWITHAIGIGDFIGRINGKDIGLFFNDGGGAGESPKYPVVTEMSYTCQDPQTTVIRVSSHIPDPERANRWTRVKS